MNQEYRLNVAVPSAYCLHNPDLACPLQHGHQHGVDDAQSGHEQGNRRHQAHAAEDQQVLKPLALEPAEKVTVAMDLTIKGVVRLPTEEDYKAGWGRMGDADVILPQQTAEELFLRAQDRAAGSFPRATVMMDREENVKEAARAIAGMGLGAPGGSRANRLHWWKAC